MPHQKFREIISSTRKNLHGNHIVYKTAQYFGTKIIRIKIINIKSGAQVYYKLKTVMCD
jgi:hypothetical protein